MAGIAMMKPKGPTGGSLAGVLGGKGLPGGGQSSYVPPPMTTNVQANPQIGGILDEMAGYRKNLAANTDHDATNAMQRQRDLMSGQMKEFGAMAGARGARPGTGAHALLMRKGMDSANRNLMGLNANLASDARQQYGQQLGAAGNLAVGQAGVTLGQQNFGLAQWSAQQQAAQAAAQLKAMQDQNMWNNISKMFTGF